MSSEIIFFIGLGLSSVSVVLLIVMNLFYSGQKRKLKLLLNKEYGIRE